MAPEDNPADDVQPTREEWEKYEQERDAAALLLPLGSLRLRNAAERWRVVWRDGFAPEMSTKALEALREALASDDTRLTQGSTTTPPPLMAVRDFPVEAGCCLVVGGWLGDGLVTVGEAEEYFARVCYEADQRLGEPAACRCFLDWFDDTPRDEMRRELLVEVERAIAGRKAGAA